MSSAVTSPFNMGNGPSAFLTPDYAPVQGTCGTIVANWTFGGAGNYPRPFTSFSQRVVEASNALGPFAMRIGDAANIGDGRIIFDPTMPEPISFREQRWYTQDDGFTGYPSKAEWWQGCIKYVVRAHDLHIDGHPVGLFEVAITNPIETEIFNMPFNPFNITGGILGSLPPILGLLTGVPSGPLGPFLGTGGPFGGPGGTGGSGPTTPIISSPPEWLLSGGEILGDIVDTADSYISNMIKTLAETISGNMNNFVTAAQNRTGETITNTTNYLSNFMEGTLDGETCLNTHLAHQVTPPDSNGSFNNIPGETKSNPRLCVLSNGGMNRLASILNNPTVLTNTGGANGLTNDARENLGVHLISQIDISTADFGLRSNGAGIGAWTIFGTTVFNEAAFPENNAAAQNPNIDNDGNLHIYDTYQFEDSNLSPLINNFRPILGDDTTDAINAFYDTAPGYHKSAQISAAGKVRQANSGGTPNNVPFSGISQTVNTYMDVVIPPDNLKQGNPALYEQLKDKGYFDHVDPSKLP